MKNQIVTYCLGVKLFFMEYIQHTIPIKDVVVQYEKFHKNQDINNSKNAVRFSSTKEKHVKGYKGKTTNKLENGSNI